MKNRECGKCELCCFIYKVAFDDSTIEDKPACMKCVHQLSHNTGHRQHGCAIYEKQPNSCRRFECGWLQGLSVPGIPDNDLWPANSHIIVHQPEDSEIVNIVLMAGHDKEVAAKVSQHLCRSKPIQFQMQSGKKLKTTIPVATLLGLGNRKAPDA